MRTPSWEEICRASRAEIRDLQDRLLARFIAEHVHPYSEWYRPLIDRAGGPGAIRSVADLGRLPFTSKADLSPSEDDPERPLKFLLKPTPETIRAHAPLGRRLGLLARKTLRGEAAVRKALEAEYRPIFLTATTGRSAAPISFLYAAPDLVRLGEAGRRLAEVLGFTTEDRGLNLFPYAPHLAFWQTVFAGWRAGLLVLSTGGGKVMGTAGTLKAIGRVRPTAIVGVPGYVHHLLRAAREAGTDLSSVRLVVLGAEKVTRPMKEAMAENLAACGARDVSIYGTYGFTEARMAWGECPAALESSGYHTYPDMDLFEVVDPETGEVLPDEADGEIVYTCLGGRGTVVLRYRTGDVVKGGIRWSPCPYCGRRVPRIGAEIGRLSNMKDLHLAKVKGTLVNLNLLPEIIAADGAVEEWQAEIRRGATGLDELAILVAVKRGREKEAEMLPKRLKEAIFAATEVTPNEVRVVPLEEILERLGMETELKERRIVDRR